MDYTPIIELGIGGLTVVGSLRYISRILARPKVVVGKKAPKFDKIDLMRYGSAGELLDSMTKGLSIQEQQIAEALARAGKDPSQDIGYQTVAKNRERLEGIIRAYNSNPVWPLLDMIVYPMARELPSKALEYITEWVTA